MKNKDSIVITGIGPLTSAGSGKESVWSAVLQKKTGLIQKDYRLGEENAGEFYVHKITDFDITKYQLNKQVLEEIKGWKEGEEIEDLYYFLAVIKMALEDSALEINEKNKHEIGLVLAHENIGMDHFYWKVINKLSFINNGDRPNTKKGFLDAFYKKFHRTGYELQTFMSLHHIAKVFDVHGFSLFLNNACASGLYALEAGADIVRSGKCKQVIVGAVDNSSIFKQIWFNEVKMLAKNGKIKPFAKDRDGFTIGDGGAAIVLEKRETAEKRGADIYAEYAGKDFNLEGWKVTYPDIANRLYERMIRNAIDDAGVNPESVDLIVPHGVGTNITDRYEAQAICGIFGKNTRKPIITALKPYIGHTLGSAAILETAIMLIGLKNKTIPATLNCENMDASIGIKVLKESANSENSKIAIKTACGFAGFNAACVFRKVN